jgi:hypothetical protein
MSKLFRALAALPVLVGALASPALADAPSIGVSMGAGPSGPFTNATTGQVNTNYQWNSGVYFRGEPLPWTEAKIGILSRSQALSMNQDSVFETSGLSMAFGAKAWFLHAGIGGELSYLRSIVQNSAAPGTLRFHNGAGFVIEPYLGATLPFLHTEFSELELSVHYPIFQMLEASIGPRVQLTIWLGAPEKKDVDDEEEEEDEDKPDEDGKPDMEEDDPDEDDTDRDEEMRPTPAPTPSPKPPAPKPKPRN